MGRLFHVVAQGGGSTPEDLECSGLTELWIPWDWQGDWELSVGLRMFSANQSGIGLPGHTGWKPVSHFARGEACVPDRERPARMHVHAGVSGETRLGSDCVVTDATAAKRRLILGGRLQSPDCSLRSRQRREASLQRLRRWHSPTALRPVNCLKRRYATSEGGWNKPNRGLKPPGSG